jgi:hypothetical protein
VIWCTAFALRISTAYQHRVSAPRISTNTKQLDPTEPSSFLINQHPPWRVGARVLHVVKPVVAARQLAGLVPELLETKATVPAVLQNSVPVELGQLAMSPALMLEDEVKLPLNLAAQ